MKLSKKVLITFIVGVSIIVVGICSTGGYVAAKVISKKTAASEIGVKTTNPITEETPEMFTGYMRRMQMKIKSNWDPPKQDASKRVVVFYKIKKNGKLSSSKIIQSSGNKDLDKAAINALKKSAPFEPLPENFKKDYVDVQFTFDYNVWKNKTKQ